MKDLQNETVLVIDDDETTRGTLRMLLEFEDFIVACCEDGQSGVDLANKRSFDVILVDYQMPGLKGDDTTRLLRALCPAAYIIGMSIESKELEFTRAGSDAFINKERLAQDLPQLARRKVR
jgi:CheY-like chemotaxis protein